MTGVGWSLSLEDYVYLRFGSDSWMHEHWSNVIALASGGRVRDVALVVVYQLGLGLFGPLSHCTLRHAIRPPPVVGLRDSGPCCLPLGLCCVRGHRGFACWLDHG